MNFINDHLDEFENSSSIANGTRNGKDFNNIKCVELLLDLKYSEIPPENLNNNNEDMLAQSSPPPIRTKNYLKRPVYTKPEYEDNDKEYNDLPSWITNESLPIHVSI
jgi:hypothetical protein